MEFVQFSGEPFTDEPNRILSKSCWVYAGVLSWHARRPGHVGVLGMPGSRGSLVPFQMPSTCRSREKGQDSPRGVLTLMSEGMSHSRTAHRGRNELFMCLSVCGRRMHHNLSIWNTCCNEDACLLLADTMHVHVYTGWYWSRGVFSGQRCIKSSD